MNRDSFNGRDLQTAFAIYQTYLSEGVTDIRELSRRLDDDIKKHFKKISDNRPSVSKKGVISSDDTIRKNEKRRIRKAVTRQRALARKGGYCPKCAAGDNALNRPVKVFMRLSKESTPQELIFTCPRCRYSELRINNEL